MMKRTTLRGALLMTVAALGTACGSSTDATKSTAPTEENPFVPVALNSLIEKLETSLSDVSVEPSTIRVSIVANGQTTYWSAAQVAAARAASSLGCVASFVSPPMRDHTQQHAVFTDQVTSKVQGIALAPIDPTEMETDIVDAKSKGISVITLDSDANPGSARTLYVGSDNFEAGKQAGKKMRELLDGQGKVAFEFAAPQPLNAIDRIRGVKDSFPELQVVDNGDDDGILADFANFAVARTLIDAAIADNPDLAGIVAGYAYHGGIVCNAVKAAGKVGKIKIVAFDTAADTMACLADGTISAVIGQRPYYQGFLSVDVLYSLATQGSDATLEFLKPWLGGSDGKTLDTGIDVLTADQLDTYKEFLASLGIKGQ